MDDLSTKTNLRSKLFVLLLCFDALLFAFGTVSRLGSSFPWQETRYFPAAMAEGIAALLLALTLIGIWLGRVWANGLAWISLWFSFFGILVGMLVLAMGMATSTKPTAFLTVAMLLVTTGALVLCAAKSNKFTS